MTPLRLEDITLFCEDRARGRSQKILEAALQELRGDLPIATSVVPIGVSSKNDVQVQTKFARQQTYRAFSLRDRDFLQRAQLDDYRRHAFHRDHTHVRPWPLARHSIESYLLDDDVLGAAVPTVEVTVLRGIVDEAAAARCWLDAARGTVDDLDWRLRQIGRQPIDEAGVGDREAALDAVRRAAQIRLSSLAEAGADDRLAEKLDALALDMKSDGPLRHRVDGRELVVAVERALSLSYAGELPAGGLLSALDRKARERPPAALLADLRAALERMPPSWQSADA
ncbi:MAG TPA: hypothetical protein VLS89_05365 [Candidatus Nanopelagicales bacterium]|nr:hypothetical protein [Candidatus Nanopelagicales bacterium]